MRGEGETLLSGRGPLSPDIGVLSPRLAITDQLAFSQVKAKSYHSSFYFWAICRSDVTLPAVLTINKQATETLLKIVSGKNIWLKNCVAKCLSAKNFRSKSPTVMSLTLTSLFKRLTLIVRRQQPDDKSRNTIKLNNDESICKTVVVKYYGNEFYGKIPTVKILTIKIMTFIG